MGIEKSRNPDLPSAAILSALGLLRVVLLGGAAVILAGDSRKSPVSGVGIEAAVPREDPADLDTIPGRRIKIGEATIRFDRGADAVPEKIASEIQSYLNELQDPSQRMRVPALASDETAKVCKFTSQWFVSHNEELKIVWSYLSENRSRWSQGIEDQFDRVAKEMKEIPWLARKALGVPDTKAAIEKKAGDRIKGGKGFNCGVALGLLSKGKLQKAQSIGLELVTEVSKFILEDLRWSDKERAERASKVGVALAKILAGAFGDK